MRTDLTSIIALAKSSIIAPNHVTENGRVIGMLLEKLDGGFASKGEDDLPACKETLGHFHRMNLIHGDVNRYNFVIDREKKPVSVRLVDLNMQNCFKRKWRGWRLSRYRQSWRRQLVRTAK